MSSWICSKRNYENRYAVKRGGVQVGINMILRVLIKDERFKKGYRQETKEFRIYSDLYAYLQSNRDRIYGQVKKYTILDKGKIKIGIVK